MIFKKGNIPWNKGLTKETDKKLNYNRPTSFKSGRTPWNKNLTKENNSKIKSMSENKKGNKNGMWGGGVIKSNGYILIKKLNHPNADKQGYIPEHRIIMEKHIGRYLTKKEVVHHKNKIKDDNKIENLKLFKNNKEHMVFHNKTKTN